MKDRCSNPKNKAFRWYGGRGISVCKRWMSFENFLVDMGDRPDGKFIERKNNNGNYEPGNCKWASKKEQARNTRTNRFETAFGITATLVELCERFDVGYKMVWARLSYGWGIEDALTKTKRKW